MKELSKLLEPNCIPTPVELAVKLRDVLKTRASDGAMFLQQLHYWIIKEQGKVVDGVRWIYNTYTGWLLQFPWWREWDFRVITKALRDEGLIKFQQLNDYGRDRTGYYTLNYDHEWLAGTCQNSSDANEELTFIHPSSVIESINETETTPETINRNTDAVSQESKPQNEQIEDACNQILRLSPSLKINKRVKDRIIKCWENFPAALEHLKKVIRENWRCNWIGVFMKDLELGVDLEELPPIPKKYPHPTLEQLNQLGEMGELVYTNLNESGYPEVLAVDTGNEIIPWWKILNIFLE